MGFFFGQVLTVNEAIEKIKNAAATTEVNRYPTVEATLWMV
jgi:hypothetical protein